MIHAPTTATRAARQALHELLALLFLLAFAGTVLYLVSGCTAAAFDTTEVTDDRPDDSANAADGPHETAVGLRANAAPSAGALSRVDHDAGPDTTPTSDVAPDARPDDGPDVGADTRAVDAAPDTVCPRRCLVVGATGAFLPLGSTICTFDGECCSGSCFVSHPGTGEKGTCTAPSGDPTTPHWCGAPGEWCRDAVEAGIARCVP